MKFTLNILKNLKDLLPYFLLIAIYFFFVNFEARKVNDNVRNEENILRDAKDSIDDKKLIIKIPVIPYDQ